MKIVPSLTGAVQITVMFVILMTVFAKVPALRVWDRI